MMTTRSNRAASAAAIVGAPTFKVTRLPCAVAAMAASRAAMASLPCATIITVGCAVGCDMGIAASSPLPTMIRPAAFRRPIPLRAILVRETRVLRTILARNIGREGG